MTPVRRFTARYGWRAYALPVLLLITALVLVAGRASDGPSVPAGSPADATVAAGTPAVGTGPTGGPPTASGDRRLKVDQPGADAQNEVLPSDALPPGGPYTRRGAGTFRVLPGSGGVVGSDAVRPYTVEVEDGVTGVDLAAFAAQVQTTLSNPQSWTHPGTGVALQRVDSGQVDFHVTLTSALTVRSLCGYEQQIETSCWAPQEQRVTLNVARWVRGDVAYVGDLSAYRTYMINHESGHALGHSHAHACLPGGLAPVMMQQTITVRAANGVLCQANPWPYPPGVTGAPGIEQPGT